MAIWYGTFDEKKAKYCYYKARESSIGGAIPNSDIDWGAYLWFEQNGGYAAYCVTNPPPPPTATGTNHIDWVKSASQVSFTVSVDSLGGKFYIKKPDGGIMYTAEIPAGSTQTINVPLQAFDITGTYTAWLVGLDNEPLISADIPMTAQQQVTDYSQYTIKVTEDETNVILASCAGSEINAHAALYAPSGTLMKSFSKHSGTCWNDAYPKALFTETGTHAFYLFDDNNKVIGSNQGTFYYHPPLDTNCTGTNSIDMTTSATGVKFITSVDSCKGYFQITDPGGGVVFKSNIYTGALTFDIPYTTYLKTDGQYYATLYGVNNEPLTQFGFKVTYNPATTMVITGIKVEKSNDVNYPTSAGYMKVTVSATGSGSFGVNLDGTQVEGKAGINAGTGSSWGFYIKMPDSKQHTICAETIVADQSTYNKKCINIGSGLATKEDTSMILVAGAAVAALLFTRRKKGKKSKG